MVSVQDEADIILTVSASINHIKNSLCVLTVHILDVLAGRGDCAYGAADCPCKPGIKSF